MDNLTIVLLAFAVVAVAIIVWLALKIRRLKSESLGNAAAAFVCYRMMPSEDAEHLGLSFTLRDDFKVQIEIDGPRFWPHLKREHVWSMGIGAMEEKD